MGGLLLLTSCGKPAYLFTSFHEPANEGLRLLYSDNGYQWKDLNKIFLSPKVGVQKVMRDPSITQGPDGTFHLVWTSSWKGDRGFGYASSKDLLHWSEEKLIPVMQDEPKTVNVWAPEIFYDDVKSEFIIVWASTIPFRFPKGQEEEENNHRLYYITTKDFVSFSPSRLFLDPAFSVIDAEIVKRSASDYILVLKDNTRPERDIKVAFGPTAIGPYSDISAPFTGKLTEGPSVAKVRDGYLIYYDSYGDKKYKAAFTKDFKTFTDAGDKILIPEGHKHGTVFRVKRKIVKRLLKS